MDKTHFKRRSYFHQIIYTVEALASDQPRELEKSGRNWNSSLTRMQSRKRLIAETIEASLSFHR